MNVPTDYVQGYEQARLVDKEAADNYVAHTTVGDPVMDAIMEELTSLPSESGPPVHTGPGWTGTEMV